MKSNKPFDPTLTIRVRVPRRTIVRLRLARILLTVASRMLGRKASIEVEVIPR